MALTDAQLENRFLYHPPQRDETVKQHQEVSLLTLKMAKTIRNTTAHTREQSLALTALEEVRMRWNQAVAMDAAGVSEERG